MRPTEGPALQTLRPHQCYLAVAFRLFIWPNDTISTDVWLDNLYIRLVPTSATQLSNSLLRWTPAISSRMWATRLMLDQGVPSAWEVSAPLFGASARSQTFATLQDLCQRPPLELSRFGEAGVQSASPALPKHLPGRLQIPQSEEQGAM